MDRHTIGDLHQMQSLPLSAKIRMTEYRAGKRRKNEKTGEITVSFTVAECGEFHSLGKYHEGIRTAEEAAAVYRNIPPGRMNGIPSIGITLHRTGKPKSEDIQLDILSGGVIDTGFLHYVPEAEGSPLVLEAVKGLERLFPEKEAAGI